MQNLLNKKILIVGNGSIGICKNSKFFINSHTGNFLKKLNENYEITFTQNSTIYDQNNNLQNFDLVESGLRFISLPNIKSKAFWSELYKLIKKHDFFYIFYPGTLGKIIALISILFGNPFGMYIRGQFYNQNMIDRFILKRSKFILTVSSVFRTDLERFCSRVEVIKPMIDIYQKDLNLDRQFENLSIKSLLFVGRVEERKGIFELLEIAKNLHDFGYEFIFNVVGGGDLFEPIKKKIFEYGLEKIFILHGLISDKDHLKSFYDKADIFIFPSHDEGFPRVLYEAMASSLPIFTTFVGGIPGRMENLQNCIEIPLKDSKTASLIIIKYFEDKRTLKMIGNNGLRTVQKIIDGSYLTHEQLFIKQLKIEK